MLLANSLIALLSIQPSAVILSQPRELVASPTAMDPKSKELIVMLGTSVFDSQWAADRPYRDNAPKL
jgi:hypothetical protein